MKTGLILFAAAVLAVVCEARLAEKVSEDDDFVVYRIPVKALDLQSQATDHFQGYELSPSYGRSSSKSTSHSKSTSSSTGSGKGRGYGQGGSSSQGHGQGYGGSSSGHGYGGSSGGQGYGGEYSTGTGQGYGGSGSGYGGSGSGYGGSGSGSGGSGSGYGGSGSGYGGHYRGSRIRPRYTSGYGSTDYNRYHSSFPSSGTKYGGGYSSPSYGGYGSSPSYSPSYNGGSHGSSPSYSPSYNGGSHGSSPSYDSEEDDAPKVITTTKTVTTSSAHDTGIDKLREQEGYSNYRQPSDSLGDIKYKLRDYLKDAPGHEGSLKFAKNYFHGASSEFHPGYRSGQGFNVNEFTRSLNQGMVGVLNNPSYRNNRIVPQASIIIPRAYAFRHNGFGLPGF